MRELLTKIIQMNFYALNVTPNLLIVGSTNKRKHSLLVTPFLVWLEPDPIKNKMFIHHIGGGLTLYHFYTNNLYTFNMKES